MESRNLPNPEPGAEVRDMIGRGHAITAIKRLREATGWGLAEVKKWAARASDDATTPGRCSLRPDRRTRFAHPMSGPGRSWA